MRQDSLDQTLLKLRDRVEFLERANASLSADRRRVMDEFQRCEEILGGLGGLSLSGALAVRLGKMQRAEARVERRRDKVVATRRERRHEILAQDFPRDTGLIGDDI